MDYYVDRSLVDPHYNKFKVKVFVLIITRKQAKDPTLYETNAIIDKHDESEPFRTFIGMLHFSLNRFIPSLASP